MEYIFKLKENAEIILPENRLELKLDQALKENRKLTIKLGFDPTAPDEDSDLSAHAEDAVNSLQIAFASDESVRTGQTVQLKPFSLNK